MTASDSQYQVDQLFFGQILEAVDAATKNGQFEYDLDSSDITEIAFDNPGGVKRVVELLKKHGFQVEIFDRYITLKWFICGNSGARWDNRQNN